MAFNATLLLIFPGKCCGSGVVSYLDYNKNLQAPVGKIVLPVAVLVLSRAQGIIYKRLPRP